MSARGGRVLDRLRRLVTEPDGPLAAVEVRPRSAALVRLRRTRSGPRLEAAVSLDLPEPALEVALSGVRVRDRPALDRALDGLLAKGGAPAGGRVALVLPDPVARVRLLPPEEVKGRTSAETADLVRFRLRAGVPFDVREARLACALPGPGQGQVVAVLAPPDVVDACEAACEAVGLHPGLVELASFALLAGLGEASLAGDRLLVNWEEDYVTFLLARDGWPLVVRTLTREAVPGPDDVNRECASTLLYYRERLGGSGLAGAVVRSTALRAAEAARLLSETLQGVPTHVEAGPPGEDEARGGLLAAAYGAIRGRAA